MELFRLSSCKYVTDLSGTGARLYGGRWNSVGTSMVYLASSRALAVLEVLVHLNPEVFPDDFCIVKFSLPENSIMELAIADLPKNWKEISFQNNVQAIGDKFIGVAAGLLLKVPSVLVEEEYNYLLNPLHPLIREVKILDTKPFIFDNRLV